MIALLRELRAARLLSVQAICYLFLSYGRHGLNLITLARFTAYLFPKRLALQDEKREVTYLSLYRQSIQLSRYLAIHHQLKRKNKVALICGNHIEMVTLLFALSHLRADIYLLNLAFSPQQLQQAHTKQQFDFIIFDAGIHPALAEVIPAEKSIQLKENWQSYNLTSSFSFKTPSLRAAKIILLSGGTTGDFKYISHKPSIFNFIMPFRALLQQVKLHQFRSLHIPLPLYHSFGLSALIVGLLLGAKIFLLNRFQAKQTCQLIHDHQVEVVTLVPTMLQRMLQENPQQLASLERIISGGAMLDAKWVQLCLDQLGDVLYNLYGSSEAGFCVIAHPSELHEYPHTIGKAIPGVAVRIVSEAQKVVIPGEIGMLTVHNTWSMERKRKRWIKTGDLAYQDAKGNIFLCGREDDMVISGGINIYPIELERVLLQHEAITEVAVTGMADADFGQRLRAFVVLEEDLELTSQEVIHWIKARVAKHLVPAQVVLLEALPKTAVGRLTRNHC